MTGFRLALPVLATLLLSLPACRGESGPRPFRAASETMKFRITPDPSPPIAREPTLYKVVVQDKESSQPIEGGEGRIFAESRCAATASSMSGIASSGATSTNISMVGSRCAARAARRISSPGTCDM